MDAEAKTLQVGQRFTYEALAGVVYTVQSVRVAAYLVVKATGPKGESATFMIPPAAKVVVLEG